MKYCPYTCCPHCKKEIDEAENLGGCYKCPYCPCLFVEIRDYCVHHWEKGKLEKVGMYDETKL